jgi:hypothetical protein
MDEDEILGEDAAAKPEAEDDDMKRAFLGEDELEEEDDDEDDELKVAGMHVEEDEEAL